MIVITLEIVRNTKKQARNASKHQEIEYEMMSIRKYNQIVNMANISSSGHSKH